MILVAGGTGRLGTAVIPRLLARELAVRVLTRDPERARHLDARVDVVRGDVRDRVSLDPALRDVSVVVSAVHGFAGPGGVSPESVDRDGNAHLIDAAAGTDAAVVLISLTAADVDSPIGLFRAKAVAEAHLRDSGCPWTIIRATSFVELWAEILAGGVVFGRGDNPINFVSVDDVAAAVERAVVDEGLRGRVVEVGGPENLTLNQLADLSREVTGRPARVRHVPRPVLRIAGAVARQPRMALAMDTQDMTFRASGSSLATPATDLRTALAATGPRVT